MHDDEDPNTVETDKPKASNSNNKPDKTIRKKLENYLDDLELKRQLNDWEDMRED